MADQHTFELNDVVEFNETAQGRVPHFLDPDDGEPVYSRLASRFGTGPFVVVDVMPVSPGNQKAAGHHQHLKIKPASGSRLPDGKKQSDWISGAWFNPA